MEKKIFFIDFDGTLMRDDKTISDKNREALRNAVDQGHYIALATGRAVSSGRRIAKELGLTRQKPVYIFRPILRHRCFQESAIKNLTFT